MQYTYQAVKSSSGLFLPAVVRPMLDSYQASKQPPQAALSDVSVAFGTNFVILFYRCLIFCLITDSILQTKLLFGGVTSSVFRLFHF